MSWWSDCTFVVTLWAALTAFEGVHAHCGQSAQAGPIRHLQPVFTRVLWQRMNGNSMGHILNASASRRMNFAAVEAFEAHCCYNGHDYTDCRLPASFC